MIGGYIRPRRKNSRRIRAGVVRRSRHSKSTARRRPVKRRTAAKRNGKSRRRR